MPKPEYTVLAVNPGSTSTKAAVYQNNRQVAKETIRHPADTLAACGGIPAQEGLRAACVQEFLARSGIPVSTLDAVVGRGGILRPLSSGTYLVDDAMLADLARPEAARHASMLGALIARHIAGPAGIPAFVVDPVAVDELDDAARLSGLPDIPRASVFHALNQKAIARRHAQSLGRRYEDCNFVVAHMGGGCTVGAHRRGRVVDVNNGITGEGPFSPERCGSLPVAGVIRMCFSDAHTEAELADYLSRTGGVSAYLGSNDMAAAEAAASTEPEGLAARVLAAMAWQVAKEIGAMAAVLEGDVDAVLLTGGVAHGPLITGAVRRRVEWIAPVAVYPGEDELLALAEGALRVLRGEEEAKLYPYRGGAATPPTEEA